MDQLTLRCGCFLVEDVHVSPLEELRERERETQRVTQRHTERERDSVRERECVRGRDLDIFGPCYLTSG